MPRRRRFSGSAAVLQSAQVSKKKGRCKGCNQTFEKGDQLVRLRLRKSFRSPCACCGHKLLGVRWFHPHCVPADLNLAMGFDPSKHGTAPSYVPPSAAHQVPPPPKPLSVEDLQFAAVQAVIGVVKARARNNPKLMAELAPDFKTFQGLTARAMRPGTPEEGETSWKFALVRALKLVY